MRMGTVRSGLSQSSATEKKWRCRRGWFSRFRGNGPVVYVNLRHQDQQASELVILTTASRWPDSYLLQPTLPKINVGSPLDNVLAIGVHFAAEMTEPLGCLAFPPLSEAAH